MDATQAKTLIEKLYDADQAERLAGSWEQIDWEKLRANDRARLEQVKDIAANEELLQELDGEVLFKLAMLFHHSEFDECVALAKPIADLSGDKGYKRGYWLGAAVEDRLCSRAGKPQIWGTQFEKVDGKWRSYQLQDDEESGVTDEMRVKRGLPPRAEQLATFLASESAT